MKIFRNIILSSVLALAAFSFASCDLFRIGEEVQRFSAVPVKPCGGSGGNSCSCDNVSRLF